MLEHLVPASGTVLGGCGGFGRYGLAGGMTWRLALSFRAQVYFSFHGGEESQLKASVALTSPL